ncbi:MAG: Bro-N domain-containing protein, partial [Parabacteroides sp.]|nr:Bro-N domain-containing protein [Parabacteroides sp.]
MNKLEIFNYENSNIRTVVKNGDPWFVAADVCAVLEIGNPSDPIRRLDEDEKGVDLIETLGGVQNMVTVNESGLYALIMGSRKPQAKAFKRWVTHEVLPAIRKHG